MPDAEACNRAKCLCNKPQKAKVFMQLQVLQHKTLNKHKHYGFNLWADPQRNKTCKCDHTLKVSLYESGES